MTTPRCDKCGETIADESEAWRDDDGWLCQMCWEAMTGDAWHEMAASLPPSEVPPPPTQD